MKSPLLVLLLSLLTFSSAWADDGDLRLGTFEGGWGGLACKYELTSQKPGYAEFYGRIHLLPTDEYDKIKVRQIANNVLVMTRYLSGTGKGQIQQVQTAPPVSQKKQFYFGRVANSGPGMKGTFSFLILPRTVPGKGWL